jgi:hypothetical protein
MKRQFFTPKKITFYSNVSEPNIVFYVDALGEKLSLATGTSINVSLVDKGPGTQGGAPL